MNSQRTPTTFDEAIGFLYGLQTFGMKFGLSGIRSLLRSVGNPQRILVTIHVAGTNGKGSTASMMAAILTAAGYKTGLYTSPHLVDYTERIRIDGRPISRKDVLRLTRSLAPAIKRNRNTFFEAATAIAFKYFSDQKVDVAVVETGLGGRLDATNVLRPLVSVITTIGLEHRHILGNSLEQIAFEKAGIIKRKTPCVTGVHQPKALQVIRRVCRNQKAQIVCVKRRGIRLNDSSWSGIDVDAHLFDGEVTNLCVSLPGSFQTQNVAIALAAIDLLRQGKKLRIPHAAIRRGLEHVQDLSGLQARLQIVSRKPLIIADVAHNPDAIRSLVRTLESLQLKKVRVLFGSMKDKEYKPMVRALASIAEEAFVVRASTERTQDPSILAEAFQRHRIPVSTFETVGDGLAAALKEKSKIPVLVTGSHFVVGEVLAARSRKKYLTISQ